MSPDNNDKDCIPGVREVSIWGNTSQGKDTYCELKAAMLLKSAQELESSKK